MESMQAMPAMLGPAARRGFSIPDRFAGSAGGDAPRAALQLVERVVVDLRIDLGPLRIQGVEDRGGDPADDEVAEPLVVGGDHVPRRPGRAGEPQRVLVRALV